MSDTPVDVIRALRDEDGPDIAALARICFPRIQACWVVPGPAGGMVVVADQEVVAAALLRIIALPGRHRIGFIAWVMTHPDHRGRGLAGRLVAASTAALRQQGCEAVVTDIEGYNTASVRTFVAAGYQRLSVGRQVLRWNPLGALWLWLSSYWAIDPGYFLWVDDAPSVISRPWLNGLAAVLFNSAVALLALSVGQGLFEPSWPSPSQAIGSVLGVGSLLLARGLGMRLVALVHRQALVYRPWWGGWGLSALIAMLFGQVFPLPGGYYPPGDDWRVAEHRAMLGRGAMLSAGLMAGLLGLAALARDGTGHALLDDSVATLRFVGRPLLVFDTLLACTPFQGFNGRRLLEHHRLAWCLLALLAVAVVLWA